MNREDLQKLIQTEIQAAAFEHLKSLNQKTQAQQTSDYLNSKSLNDDDIDLALFHGGKAPEHIEKNKGRITIKEGTDSNLKITIGEIKDFENSFREMLDDVPGASIVFDKQKNGYSIIATKRPDGVEAKASGILNMGDNGKIIWAYSILNGINLNAQNVKLNQDNKMMFEALYNHYNDWQKKWRENLNLPGAPESEETAQAPIAPVAPSPTGAPATQAAPAAPTAPTA